MFKFIFRKLTGKGPVEEGRGSKAARIVRDKSAKFLEFCGNRKDFILEECAIIQEKCKDLNETNYQLGLSHLERGNLPEAIFRFRITKKIWPHCFEAYYQLAYCLTLKEKYKEAEKVLKDLLHKKPDYDPLARELLEKLKEIRSNA